MVMACPAILVCSKLKPGMAKKRGGGRNIPSSGGFFYPWGGGAVGPLPRFFGGFDIVYRGKPEVIMDPKRKSRRSSRSDLLYQIRSW